MKNKKKSVQKSHRHISRKTSKKEIRHTKSHAKAHTKAHIKAHAKTHAKAKKPKIKNERVQTLIPNFDLLIERGFEKNSTNLLVGSSGSGKSIFSTQFLIGGIKKGEKCLYVTFEEKKEQFYRNMKEFGWDLEDYEKKGKFLFLEYTPIKVKTMLEEGGGDIESTILERKISRIVIDSITSFALLFDKELEKREAAIALFNMIRKWNCTSLLTFEGNPEDNENESKAIEFESDSIIKLYFVRDKIQRERYLEVIKMRGTNHSKKIYPFDIEKHGIYVSKRPCKKPPLNLV